MRQNVRIDLIVSIRNPVPREATLGESPSFVPEMAPKGWVSQHAPHRCCEFFRAVGNQQLASRHGV